MSEPQGSPGILGMEPTGNPNEMTVQSGRAFGFDTNVQHPVDSGKTPSALPGKAMVSPVVGNGHAFVMLALEHSDGTTLSAFLSSTDLEKLQACISASVQRLVELELAAL